MTKAQFLSVFAASLVTIAPSYWGDGPREAWDTSRAALQKGDGALGVACNELTYEFASEEDQFLTFKSQRALTMMYLAIHDALNTIGPRYERYACTAERTAAHPVADAAWAAYPSLSDLEEVESITRDYIQGWYMGDVARMDRALHDDLLKRMPVREGSPETTRLHPVSKARMLELTAEGGGENPDAVFEIIIDDISRDIATARVASPEYLDYLHLAKTSSGWKIVNVLFHTHD